MREYKFLSLSSAFQDSAVICTKEREGKRREGRGGEKRGGRGQERRRVRPGGGGGRPRFE